MSIAALLSGVLNAIGRFVAAAAAPILLNIILDETELSKFISGCSETLHEVHDSLVSEFVVVQVQTL